MKKTKTAVICGLHRSGTTYIGRILSLADSTFVLHEPLNPVWGLEYAPPAYTYSTGTNTSCYIEEIVCKALEFHGNFAKPVLKKRDIKKIGFKFFGGKQHLQWSFIKLLKFLRMPPRHIVWKDPFCTFMADYLSRIRKMKIVVMVRHPCAQYFSVNKQNWHFDIENLTRQQELINDYGKGIAESYWEKAKNDNLISNAILWKLMSRMLTSVSEENANLIIVRHEDLCMKPNVEINRIFNHLGMDFTPPMKKYIKLTSQGSSAEAPAGQVHGFHRDSKLLINIWRENLPKVQIRTILQIVDEDIRPFYNA